MQCGRSENQSTKSTRAKKKSSAAAAVVRTRVIFQGCAAVAARNYWSHVSDTQSGMNYRRAALPATPLLARYICRQRSQASGDNNALASRAGRPNCRWCVLIVSARDISLSLSPSLPPPSVADSCREVMWLFARVCYYGGYRGNFWSWYSEKVRHGEK